MAIFASKEDAVRFAVRRLYLDVLGRQLESPQIHEFWVNRWLAAGGDVVLAEIMDSAEGQAVTGKRRQHFGL